MVNRIRNTREQDPLLNLVETSPTFGGSVESQEARGQTELVTSDVLPSDCDSETRAALETAGVIFGEPVDGDDLFVHVQLPAGWKKQPTDHSMWSDLVDSEGGIIASIFYKAAFYDRKAFMRLA